MKTLILCIAGMATCFAANPVGDWRGTLKTDGPELRLALHIQGADGEYKATLDSLDQGANGIPVAKVTLAGNRLKLDVDAVKGGFEGDVAEDDKTISGTWSQGGRELPLVFARHDGKQDEEEAGAAASVAPLLGVWDGTLSAGENTLRLRFTLSKNEKGAITGKFDSLDQQAMGIPMSGMSLNAGKFHFDLRAAAGAYDGSVSADGKSIEGTWQQKGAESPLVWKKTK